MRRFGLILFGCILLAGMAASAGDYTLTDGSKISGEPISENDGGVEIKTGPDTVLPRISWDKFTQESLQTLLAEAKSPRERSLIEPLIDQLPSQKAKRKEITVKPIETPERPTRNLGVFALFSSPVGWFILLVLYAGNLFAAYEVAFFRHQPPAMVCGLAAIPFFGVLSPIIFLVLPPPVPPPEAEVGRADEAPVPMPVKTGRSAASPLPMEASPVMESSSVEPVAAPGSAAAPALPEPVVYPRGEFAFNRRFFETKMPGFFRVVPSEADRDLVILIKSGRGDFIGKRISRITPTELYLQTFSNNATADELIPFGEVLEVQVRHKDLV